MSPTRRDADPDEGETENAGADTGANAGEDGSANADANAEAAAGERADATNAWDPAAYDGAHSFVYEYGEDVLSLLAPEADERVLDLGCGTGHLTAEIARRGSEVVGLDNSTEMIARAREAHPEVAFERGDARTVAFDSPFDAVFSNAALHWIPDGDQDAVLASVHDALRPGGRFVAELGGTGNVETVVAAVRDAMAARGYEAEDPWYFPSVGEYAPRLEAHGFEVRYATLFDRPTELDDGEKGLRAWLGMFGDSLLAPLSRSEREAVVADVEDALRPDLYDEGTWVADYRRLRFVAVRE